MKLLPVLALALLVPGSASAQVLITEVEAAPATDGTAEWLEIQNLGAAPVSIAGWTLNDFGPTPPRRFAFPAGATLDAGQVIVIARRAVLYANEALDQSYPLSTASYELADGGDDPLVTNLAITVMGGGSFGLNNTNDALLLLTDTGAFASGCEYGTTDRIEIPGVPETRLPAVGQTLVRVADSGSSIDDFEAGVPTPGIGWNASAPTPPMIAGTTYTPRHVSYGDTVHATSRVTDPEGVAIVSFYAGAGTSSTGPVAGYLSYNPVNDVASIPVLGTAPATFHSIYLRFFVRAQDNTGAIATDPAGATDAFDNGSYVQRNVLPAAVSSIKDAREQGADELPLWGDHSVKVEGIVLTKKVSFVANRTNFFIVSSDGQDAIRVFDDEVIATDVNPGDLVRVTGLIGIYNGLRQIGGPDLIVENLGPQATHGPTPRTIAELLAASEQLESQLVTVNGLRLVNAESTWPMNGSVDVTDGTGTISVRVASLVDLSGAPAPSGAFDLTGILAQFAPSGRGGYQIQPRDMQDVHGHAEPPVDAGVEVDSGVEVDAGHGGHDAGTEADAGHGSSDAGNGNDGENGNGNGNGGNQNGGNGNGMMSAGSAGDRGCDCATSNAQGNAALALLALALGAIVRRRSR